MQTINFALGKEFPQTAELELTRENHAAVIRELQRMQDDLEYVSERQLKKLEKTETETQRMTEKVQTTPHNHTFLVARKDYVSQLVPVMRFDDAVNVCSPHKPFRLCFYFNFLFSGCMFTMSQWISSPMGILREIIVLTLAPRKGIDTNPCFWYNLCVCISSNLAAIQGEILTGDP